MTFHPQAYLIGAQKSGTTSLAHLLGQHPAICVAEPKEPDYFTRHWERGLDWYRECFTAPAKLCLDASTSYSCAPIGSSVTPHGNHYVDVPKRIFSVAPEARFIYIVRHPVDRCYSSYWHDVRAGREQRPFLEAIERDRTYIDGSLYAAQMDLYLQYFAKERILVVTFDDFCERPKEVARACFRFIGVEEEVALELEQAKNRSFAYGGFAAVANRALAPVGGLNPLMSRVKRWVPQALRETMLDMVTQNIPSMPAEQRAKLLEFFAPQNERLKPFIGDLPATWSK